MQVLNTGLWTLDTVAGWFRTGSELSFWFSLHHAKCFGWISLRSHDGAYSVGDKGPDVVILKFYINVKSDVIKAYELQAAISHCLEAAIHHSHLFLKISPKTSGVRVLLLVKLQTDCSK